MLHHVLYIIKTLDLSKQWNFTRVDAKTGRLPAATAGCVPSMQCTHHLQHTHLSLMSSCGHLPAGHRHLPVQTKYKETEKKGTSQCTNVWLRLYCVFTEGRQVWKKWNSNSAVKCTLISMRWPQASRTRVMKAPLVTPRGINTQLLSAPHDLLHRFYY